MPYLRTITSFAGSSPPEIFVGRYNYPNVYAGILSPSEYGDTAHLSSAEHWHARKLPIPEIVNLRSQLIYGRSTTNVNQPTEKFVSVMQEIAMTHKPIATEFTLKKPMTQNTEQESHVPLIANAALLHSVRLQENPAVKPKVEYLVNDTASKATTALLELEKAGTETSALMKLLSAGLLGQKENRKLVPTRWSITAVDDTLSKEKLKRIRFFPELKEISVFTAEYLGNHYEFLLLPDHFAFEVIEIALEKQGVWHDSEEFVGRTTYASSVTGAYYANRLALTEYLEHIQRQARCLVMREIRPEYTAPLGVGILRQTSREAFSHPPKTFATLKEMFTDIQSRLKQPITNYLKRSILLKEFGKQKRLNQFF